MLPKSTNKFLWYRNCTICGIAKRNDKAPRCKPCGYKRRREMFKERFWTYVNKTESCWVWTAGTFQNGYGMFTVNGMPKKAHRVSYEIANGSIPKGMSILHKCDMRPCVRPDHLWAGTTIENVKDRDAKHRGSIGERQPMHKITNLTAKEIRKIYYSSSNDTYKSLAKRYGVSAVAIRNVITRRTWKHV